MGSMHVPAASDPSLLPCAERHGWCTLRRLRRVLCLRDLLSVLQVEASSPMIASALAAKCARNTVKAWPYAVSIFVRLAVRQRWVGARHILGWLLSIL
jgi:hypothetical protein